jgi:hypothetical protein
MGRASHQVVESCGTGSVWDLGSIFRGHTQFVETSIKVGVFFACNHGNELASGDTIFQIAGMCNHRSQQYDEGIEEAMVLDQVSFHHLSIHCACCKFLREFVMDHSIPLFTGSLTEFVCKSTTLICRGRRRRRRRALLLTVHWLVLLLSEGLDLTKSKTQKKGRLQTFT